MHHLVNNKRKTCACCPSLAAILFEEGRLSFNLKHIISNCVVKKNTRVIEKFVARNKLCSGEEAYEE